MLYSVFGLMCFLPALFFRKAKLLEMLGETEEVQENKIEYLSKLCDCAENYTHTKSFENWQSKVGKNTQQRESQKQTNGFPC